MPRAGQLKTHCLRNHEYTPQNTTSYVRKRDGVTVRICKTCTKARRKGTYRRDWLKRYNLTEASYEEMQKEQGRVCKICEQPSQERPLRVDHDHETGRVRGLLCHHCNVALGHFRDNPELLIKAVKYLGGNLV